LGDITALLMETSEKGLRETKEKIEATYRQRFNIKYYSQMGFAEEVILETAKKTNADLIVMGIVGDTNKNKLHPIGSTAIKVARNADIPVFIIPDGATYHPIKKISFTCNLEKIEGGDLIYVSRYFAKAFDAALEIINVEKPDEEFSEEKSKTYKVIEQKLANIAHKSVFITDKNIGKALEKYFNTHSTDVIMLSPRKLDLFHNLFSHSISKELAFHSKYPLLCIY
jgi:NAD(P)H-hydrate repair Nnr-like enzyme with NAD(P)H-hydrate epimerase domain